MRRKAAYNIIAVPKIDLTSNSYITINFLILFEEFYDLPLDYFEIF